MKLTIEFEKHKDDEAMGIGAIREGGNFALIFWRWLITFEVGE